MQPGCKEASRCWSLAIVQAEPLLTSSFLPSPPSPSSRPPTLPPACWWLGAWWCWLPTSVAHQPCDKITQSCMCVIRQTAARQSAHWWSVQVTSPGQRQSDLHVLWIRLNSSMIRSSMQWPTLSVVSDSIAEMGTVGLSEGISLADWRPNCPSQQLHTDAAEGCWG